MNTRSSDKNEILYSLFDWGDNKRLLPTESFTESDTDKLTGEEQFDSQTENFQNFDCEESLTPIKSEITRNRTSESETQHRLPPLWFISEDSNRPISPIIEVIDREDSIGNKLDESKDNTQDYSAFLDDIEQYLITRKLQTEKKVVDDYSPPCKDLVSKTKEFESNHQDFEWDHFNNGRDKDLALGVLLEGEGKDILEFFRNFIQNQILSKDPTVQEESKVIDFTLDYDTGLGIKEEKQKEQQATYHPHMGDQFLDSKPFRGTQSEDPREWIEKVESWLSYKNYANLPNPDTIEDEDEKQSIRTAMGVAKRRIPYILGLLLQGSAGNWSCGLTTEEKETFATFKDRFRVRYLDDRTNKYSSLVNVWEERQKPNETVDTYYDSHVKLVKLARLTADGNTNQAFVHGLLPHIKMQVILQGKVELKELLEAARLAETAYGTAIGKTGSSIETTAAAATTSKKTTKAEVSNIQDTASDVRAIKVLRDVLKTVVGATVGKTTPSATTSPSSTQESIPEVQKIESQLDFEHWEQPGNALNWIGHKKITNPNRSNNKVNNRNNNLNHSNNKDGNHNKNNLNHNNKGGNHNSNNINHNKNNSLNRNNNKGGNRINNNHNNINNKLGVQGNKSRHKDHNNMDNPDNNQLGRAVYIVRDTTHQDGRIVG